MTIKLNPEQQALAERIMRGQSLAIIAEAGTGKSEILKRSLPKLKGVMVVAPTGAAALQVGMGASTIHRAFGLKPVIQDPSKFGNKVQKPIVNALKRVKVLVVDEIGSVRVDLLAAMDARLKMVKENDLPFGGVQCIFVGDIMQTPSVLTAQDAPHYRRLWGDDTWFFTSPLMADIPTYTLSKVERNTNARQQRILQSIRNKDRHCELALQRLWEESEPYNKNDGKIILCQFNKDADKVNEQAFNSNTNQVFEYKSLDDGDVRALKGLNVPEILRLKVGIKVMLTMNDPAGDFVNGDTGVVVSCEDSCVRVLLDRSGAEVVVGFYTYEVLKYKARGMGLSTSVVAERNQLPIRLGYALSIHKAQGATFESVTIDMGNLPERYTMPATFYVAVSRVRDLRNLSFVRPPRLSDVKVDIKAVTYYNSISGKQGK